MLVKRDVEATSLKRTVERMKRELQQLQQQQQQSQQQQQQQPGGGEADSKGQQKQPSPPQQQQQQRSGPPPAQQAPHSWAHRAQQQQQQHQQQQQQREGTAQSFQHGVPPFFNQFQHHPFFQQFFSASGFPFGSAPYGGQHHQQQPQQPCQPPPASSSKPAGAFPDLAAEPPVFAQSTSAGALKVFLLQAGVSEVQITGATMHQAAWAAGMLETCATGFQQDGSAKVLYSFNYFCGDTGVIAS